jgi:DNA helicase-2/ATP-dependent DNA helicase PcrA
MVRAAEPLSLTVDATAPADAAAPAEPTAPADGAAGGTEPPAASEHDDVAIVSAWRHQAALLLAERDAAGRPADAVRPRQISVSLLAAAHRDPDEVRRRLRRPLPQAPSRAARLGTAFHAWLESRFARPGLLDLDELPGAADADAADDGRLAALQLAFLASPWADRTPIEVETAFEAVVGDVVVRGRVDAVFADPDGTLWCVDWKTGPPSADPAEVEARSVQLAVYRLAFAALAGVPVERVRAVFHHVAEGVTIEPSGLLDADGLRALVAQLGPSS